MNTELKNSPVHLRQILTILLLVLFVFFVYTFLHEMGHVLAGWLFGESLTEFNASFWDLSAHVSMVGGHLTPAQRAVQSVAGVSVPLLLWFLLVSLVPGQTNGMLERTRLIASLFVLSTLLAWIIMPVLTMLGIRPFDDVTCFLEYSQTPPLLVTATAAALYAGGWSFFLRRVGGVESQMRLLHANSPLQFTRGVKTTVGVMTTLVAVCIGLVFLFTETAARNVATQLAVPPGFEPVAQIDLSTQPHSTEALAQFSLEEPTPVGVFVSVQHINTGYFDLSLVGSGGQRFVVMHGEDYRADQDCGLWQNELPPGTYDLVLDAEQSPGTACVYLKKE